MTRARDVANLIGSGNYSSTTFTATAGQTAFTISHTQGFIQVFMNGLLLDETVDYTSNGSAVTLTSGAAAGDEIEVVAYNTFSVGDALNQAAADTRYVNATGDNMTGDLTTTGKFGVGTSSPNRLLSVSSNSTITSGFDDIAEYVAPSIGVGGSVSLNVGRANSSYNLGKMAFKYSGAGSTSNQLGLGFYGADNLLNVNGSGHVTIPNQPSFAAAVSANNWTTSSAADCPFDNELFDIGGHYNSSNYTFTAPVAGRYFTSFFLNRYTDSRFDIAFMVNGSARHGLEVREAGAGQWHMESAQVILNLAANDAVKMRITGVVSTGTAIFDGGGSYYDVFSMHLLG